MIDTSVFPVADCDCDHDWGEHGTDGCLVDFNADDPGPPEFCPCTARWINETAEENA